MTLPFFAAVQQNPTLSRHCGYAAGPAGPQVRRLMTPTGLRPSQPVALVMHGSTLAKQPALRTQTVEIENESAMWASFTTGAQLVEIVPDVPCRVVFGEDPEPTLDGS